MCVRLSVHVANLITGCMWPHKTQCLAAQPKEVVGKSGLLVTVACGTCSCFSPVSSAAAKFDGFYLTFHSGGPCRTCLVDYPAGGAESLICSGEKTRCHRQS